MKTIVGINGACGRMGQRLVVLGHEHKELAIGAAHEAPGNPRIGGMSVSLSLRSALNCAGVKKRCVGSPMASACVTSNFGILPWPNRPPPPPRPPRAGVAGACC